MTQDNWYVMLTCRGKNDTKIDVSTPIELTKKELSEYTHPNNTDSVTQNYIYIKCPIQKNINSGFLCYYTNGKYKWRKWTKDKQIPSGHINSSIFISYEEIYEQSYVVESEDSESESEDSESESEDSESESEDSESEDSKSEDSKSEDSESEPKEDTENEDSESEPKEDTENEDSESEPKEDTESEDNETEID